MKINYILKHSLFVFYSLIIFSCNHKQKTDKLLALESIIENTIGKKLIIPKNMEAYSPFSNYIADSISISNAPYKIYSRIDASCGTCISHVGSWNNLAIEFKKYDIPIVLIFFSNDKFELIKYYCESGIIKEFPYPFFLDIEDKLKKNDFMLVNKNFESVLADRDNKIIAMGNPAISNKIKELYIKEIRNRIK